VRARRVERLLKILNRMKRENKGKIRVFRNEKFFTRPPPSITRNSKYLPDIPVANVDKSIHVLMRAKASEKIIVLGVY